MHAGVRPEIVWVASDEAEGLLAEDRLAGLDGICVPGGFGIRGTEGKIAAVRYARENRVPYLGLCLGLQAAVIEFARNVCGLTGANSLEFDEATPHPVIALLDSQRGVEDKGGTMRLGNWPCRLLPGTRAAQVYGDLLVYERHRHRFEVNPHYRGQLESNGLVCSGISPDNRLVEMIELPDHPFFLASQFHPEFTSRPNRPNPLFREFIAAAAKQSRDVAQAGAEAAPPERRTTGAVSSVIDVTES